MDGRGMMFRQVVSVKPSGVEALDLEQALAIETVERHIWYRFDVVKHAKLQRHMLAPLCERALRCSLMAHPMATALL
jgi:hypothetical protein